MHGNWGAAAGEFAEHRQKMVLYQLAERGIQDTRVLDAMAEVPREAFVPAGVRHLTYEDCALPLADNQTISQPYMVGAMIEALHLRGDETVLEVGTGSGYSAAVLSRLVRRVITMERQPALAERAAARLAVLGYSNITVQLGDGTRGWPAAAPYAAIVVAAGAPQVPAALVAQLADGGRLVLPVGDSQEQMLVCLTRTGDRVQRTDLLPCMFVPLIGADGWTGPE